MKKKSLQETLLENDVGYYERLLSHGFKYRVDSSLQYKIYYYIINYKTKKQMNMMLIHRMWSPC